MMKKICWILLASALLAIAAVGDHSFTIKTAEVDWAPVEMDGMPPGLQLQSLHENPRTNMMSAIVKYPQGFREPRHHHDTCGHYIYVLKGRLTAPGGDLLPGMFAYVAPKEPHGPYTALEGTEIIFYTDGAFDFISDE